MKKIIGVDIDGVITDEGDSENNIWQKALSEYMKRTITRKRDVYNFNRAFDLSPEVIDDFFNEKLESIYWNVDPLYKAKETINFLIKRDFKVILITARDKSFRDLTVKWLKEHGIDYTELFHEKDKAPLAVEKNIELFIEDNHENAVQIVNHGIKVLLMDKYHNQDLKDHDIIYRVDDWSDIRKHVLNFFKSISKSAASNKFF